MNTVKVVYDEDNCIYDITPTSSTTWEELQEYLKLVFQLEDLQKDGNTVKYVIHLEEVSRNLRYKSLAYAINSRHEWCKSLQKYKKELDSLQQFT